MRPLQFVRIRSVVEIPFWSVLTDKIVNEWHESPSNQSISAEYGFGSDLRSPPIFQFNGDSFDIHRKSGDCLAPGTLICLPTAKSWESFNAPITLSDCANRIWDDVEQKRAMSNPSLLSRFVFIVYPDVKRHVFQYWFGIPAIAPQLAVLHVRSEPVDEVFSRSLIESILAAAPGFVSDGFFAIQVNSERGSMILLRLAEIPNLKADTYFVFVDPALRPEAPSWLLRNFLVAIASRFGTGEYRIIRLKRLDSSCITVETVAIAADPSYALPRPVPVGWEANVVGKLGPRSIDLSSFMNPEKLSESSVNLNLRLMKWRQFPDLNVDMLNRLSVLVIGAGTLGCSAARDLAAWGVRNFTFVDSGRVSYSNPTRQSLYNFEDCLKGGKPKAVAAAEALNCLCPSINATGYELRIAMIGHPIGASAMETSRKQFETLEQLVDTCDLAFLLTDSRESRWLPTVMCAAKNKPLMNCALGFDTFVVMRNGLNTSGGGKLGCYFCQDVTAPADSISDRSLDQQCTVTRPGVAPLASAIAVELAVSLLHNPLAEAASPEVPFSMSFDTTRSLGLIPHQIRGWLAQYHLAILKGTACSTCIACSHPILSEYQHRGWDFVVEAIHEPLLLESISGIGHIKSSVDEQEWELESCDEHPI